MQTRTRHIPPPLHAPRVIAVARQYAPMRARSDGHLVGWIIFGVLTAIVTTWLSVAFRSGIEAAPVNLFNPNPPSASTAPTPALSPLHFAGWTGYLAAPQWNLGLIAMESTHAQTVAFKALFAADFIPLVLVIDNSNGDQDITLNTEMTILRRSDGSALAAPSQMAILQTAVSHQRGALIRGLSSPQVIKAGQVADGRIIFVPANTDLSEITSVSIKLNGEPVEIPGRLFTVEEKAQRLRSSRPQPLVE